MKKIAITLLAAAFFTASATAQQKRTMKAAHHHKHQHDMMAKQLNFSEDQKKQANTYKADFRKKMQELNKKETITVKEQRDQKYALRKEQKAKMQALLTPEQKTKMAQLKADRKIKKEQHFTKHLDKMKTNLSLTDVQVTQLRSQKAAMQLKVTAIKANESLTREQRKTQMMALKDEAREQHKKIFTADQLKKIEEMKKKRMDKSSVK